MPLTQPTGFSARPAQESGAWWPAAGGAIDSRRLDSCQHAVHGLAWVATCVESLRQMLRWAESLEPEGRLGETEQLVLDCAFQESLAQLTGGIAMSQGEIVRLRDLRSAATISMPCGPMTWLI